MAQALDGNLALKTVRNIYLVLNKALKKAQSQGLIRQNPCGEAEMPSYDTPQKVMRPLKDAEVTQFLKLIAAPLAIQGLRQGI